MNSTKLILGLAFVGATVAANAGLTLTVVPTAKSHYGLDGNFVGAAAFPTANSATGTSSIVVNPTMMGDGQINGWWLTAVSNAPVGTITYAITLSGINASSTVDYYLHAYSYNPTSGQIGPAHYGAGIVQNLVNIEALTGSTASTQTWIATLFAILRTVGAPDVLEIFFTSMVVTKRPPQLVAINSIFKSATPDFARSMMRRTAS